ncbi:phage terminase large subunit [Bacillus haynesii]|uniref:phage terminase large subunit n=1 Tax=Bacillus haynesii TaxID=1925021 RepID=UPI002280B3ED|nr:phage terminase large subunit [Bacillus haynesii]MCY8048458.1 phage terminase large subunit [Bacillus haynesii]MCY8668796.1 phage terminase large subunit [Bacillus haynesii]MCY9324065.1 phage terminase large subunit [Bacillus haynesii]
MNENAIKLTAKIKGKTIDELREEQKDLKGLIYKIVTKLKAGEDVDEFLIESLPDLKERLAYLNRVVTSHDSTLFFMYEYFSDEKNPDNEGNIIPKGVSIEDAPDFHVLLTDTLNTLSTEEITNRIAWSVPRGHAKSAYLSNMFPVHQIVFGLRRYIIIVSETLGMSRKFVEWVNDQLKYNEKLREDFGTLVGTDRELKDNADSFETNNGCFVQASSIGGQLRGSRYKAYRPDLIILDDLESSKNTNTLDLRTKNEEWFNKVVMPMGDPRRTAIIYMGTLVHASGLLPAVLNRADFNGKMFSAIVSEPDRQDLWDEFENIYRDQENPDRMDEAISFYEANKEEMDKGVSTLWNDRFPYYKLMMEKVNIGSRAFGSEFLNKPIDDETAVFKSSYFLYYDDKDLYDQYGRPLPLDVFGFWDIAIGKNVQSDYNAIVTLGRDRRTGVIYVLDAWARKCPMHEALRTAEQKISEYGHKIFGVETVQAQYDMFRQLRENATKRGLYKTRFKACNPKGKKEDRIIQLEPLFENGTIRMKRSQRLLIEQLQHFLNHDNDDLPDALASAVELCGGNRRRTFLQKPAGL